MILAREFPTEEQRKILIAALKRKYGANAVWIRNGKECLVWRKFGRAPHTHIYYQYRVDENIGSTRTVYYIDHGDDV